MSRDKRSERSDQVRMGVPSDTDKSDPADYQARTDPREKVALGMRGPGAPLPATIATEVKITVMSLVAGSLEEVTSYTAHMERIISDALVAAGFDDRTVMKAEGTPFVVTRLSDKGDIHT